MPSAEFDGILLTTFKVTIKKNFWFSFFVDTVYYYYNNNNYYYYY